MGKPSTSRVITSPSVPVPDTEASPSTIGEEVIVTALLLASTTTTAFDEALSRPQVAPSKHVAVIELPTEIPNPVIVHTPPVRTVVESIRTAFSNK